MRISDWSSDVCSSDLVKLDIGVNAHRLRAVAYRFALRPLARERIEPVECLVDFDGAEASLGQPLEDRAIEHRFAIAGGIGIVIEIMFEQVQPYIEYGFFHYPQPAPVDAMGRVAWPSRPDREDGRGGK